MARHAIINKNNKVVNIVVWEGHPWLPPINHTVVQTEVGQLGDTYDADKKVFIKPEIPQ